MKIKKKYTLEEFEAMFDEAKIEAVKQTMETASKGINDKTAEMAIMLLAIDSIEELKKRLFDKKGE